MSMLLDLIIIAVIVISAVVGMYRGIFRTVIGFAGFCIAVLAGAVAAVPLSRYIQPSVEPYFESDPVRSISAFLAGFNVTARSVSTVLAFSLVFLLVILLTALLIIFSKYFLNLPVIKQVDRWLGFALGAVTGILGAWVLSIILFNCSELLVRAFDSFDASMFGGSVVAKWFYEHNLFGFIMNLA